MPIPWLLAERLGVTVDVAFAVMRRYSRANQRKLTDVAADITRGRLDLAHPPAGTADVKGSPVN